MNKGIIGKKIGMTQIFDEKGNVIPVTVIETAGNIVSQIKTVETVEKHQWGFASKTTLIKKLMNAYYSIF